jgi:hypothetical protein
MLPRDTLYGSAIVLPQVAQDMEWHPKYIGLCVEAAICLFLVYLMQGIFVYEVARLVQAKDQQCDRHPDYCLDRGFRLSDRALIGGRDRWYRCFPPAFNSSWTRHEIIYHSPGSASGGGLHLCRRLCVVAFVIFLFKEVRQSWEMLRLLLKLPGQHEPWVVVVDQLEENAKVNHDKTQVPEIEVERKAHVKWQINGMDRNWKILSFCTLIVPKMLLCFLLLWYGSEWLMNTYDHGELILNAVALVFVLDLDEAVFFATSDSDTCFYMDNLDPWRDTSEDEEGRDEAKAAHNLSSHRLSATLDHPETRWRCAMIVVTVGIFPVLLVGVSVIFFVSYERRCKFAVSEADTMAVISGNITLPRGGWLSLVSG